MFDGSGGPYDESAPTNPINVYGRHKRLAEGELATLLGDRLLVARLICVWGRESAAKNFTYQVMRAAAEGRPLRLPSDQLGNPTWAGDIAHWSVRLLEAGESGIWHLAGDGPATSRIEWAHATLDSLRAAGRPHEVVVEALPTSVLGAAAPRPLRAGMDTTKIQRRFPRACRHPGAIPMG